MNDIHSFEPIINSNSEVLILGTLPGPQSLSMKQYYAHPQNQFWRILYHLFGREKVDSAYEEKIRFVLEHRIAIWDIFHTAERKGALDSNIKNVVVNDIMGLVEKYPNIKRILLSGRTSEKAFLSNFPSVPVSAIYVPSPSPAHTKPLDEKIRIWREALEK